MFQSILTAIVLSMSFESGYVPKAASTEFQYQSVCDYQEATKTYYISMSPRVELFGLHVQANYSFFTGYRIPEATGGVHRGLWEFNTGYQLPQLIDNINIELGYRHMCSHVISTYQDSHHNVAPKTIDNSFDKLFVKITLSNR